MARILPLCCALFALLSPAAHGAASPTLPQAAEAAAAQLEHGGVVVAVQESGQPAQVHAFGALAGTQGTPADQLVFEIGSISKMFTGLLLAQAVVEGKLQLDDTLGELLDAELSGADGSLRAITLEQLSTHRSCLPRLPANLAPADGSDPYADYDAAKLHAALRALELAAPPPCPPEYSNLGVGVLGHVLERAYEESWNALVQQKIAQPAGMRDTVQVPGPQRASRLVQGHAGAEPAAPWTFQALAAAGALRSTAADLLALGQALLDPAHALAPAWKLASTMRADMGPGSTRTGLGVFETTSEDATWLWHNGGTGGFRSELRVYPAPRRVEVVLTSNSDFQPGAIYARMQPAPEPVEGTRAPIQRQRLQQLAGVYALNEQAAFTVLERNGTLWVRLTGQPFLPVFHMGDERFSYEAVRAELQFESSDAGDPTAVVLFQGGQEMRARRTDTALPQIQFPAEEALQEYVGTYTLAPRAVFTISVQAGTLIARLTGQQPLPVFAVGADRFEYDAVPAALQFERDAGGKVQALVLHQNGLEQRAPKDQ